MKRIMAVLMMAVLLMGCAPGVANAYTLDEKFIGQAGSQAVKGEITFFVTGDGAAAMDAALFQLLEQLLPGTRITFAATLGERFDRGGSLQVFGADGSEKEVKFLFDDESIALGGNAIAKEGVYYRLNGMPRLKTEGTLPGVDGLLMMFEGMDEAWQKKAAQRLSAYETMLSVWMNDYAGTGMGREGDTLYSELSCTIPAAAVKQKIKDMLHIFYQDGETLQLLSEALQGTDGELYVNPAMEYVLASLVDGLPLRGDVQVTRRFDSQGVLLVDSITLPLPDMPLPGLGDTLWQQIGVEKKAGGDCTFRLMGTKDEQIYFDLQTQQDGKITGQLRTELQSAAGNQALQHVGYDFAWEWKAEEETYSLKTDICEMPMQGTLTLTPDSETDRPRQQITLDVLLASTSSRGAPVTMAAALRWTDMEGGAQVEMKLNLRTAGHFAQETAVEEIFFDDLPAAEQQAVLQQLVWLIFNQAVVMPE